MAQQKCIHHVTAIHYWTSKRAFAHLRKDKTEPLRVRCLAHASYHGSLEVLGFVPNLWVGGMALLRRKLAFCSEFIQLVCVYICYQQQFKRKKCTGWLHVEHITLTLKPSRLLVGVVGRCVKGKS